MNGKTKAEYIGKERENKGVIPKAICPKCHKHFSHRNKKRCPNCGVFLAWPGEYFCVWERGYFWVNEEYREIKEIKEWILKNTLKDPSDHYGSIVFDGEQYFWRDTL